MRTKEVLASIAIVGAVAAFAFFNSESIEGQSLFRKHQDLYETSFNHFIAKYGKRYGTKEEYNYRKKIFIKNYHAVMDHNTMNAEEHGYTKRINHFSDLTDEEFETNYKGLRVGSLKSFENAEPIQGVTAVKDFIDWRDDGAVTKVKN